MTPTSPSQTVPRAARRGGGGASRATLVALAMLAGSGPAMAERAATVTREAFACRSWAGWREYTQASLTPRGGRISKECPIRLAKGTQVTMIEEDYGWGSSEIGYRGKHWFVDNQRLD